MSWLSEILAHAVRIVRYIGHAKPNGTEANAMKKTPAVLHVITIINAGPCKKKSQKRRKNNGQ